MVWEDAGMCGLSRYLMTGVGGEEIKSLGPGRRSRDLKGTQTAFRI